MVGYLRLILAALVALAHAEVSMFGYHLGVPAVVVFYLLAGYVVALQWETLSQGRSRLQAALAFYRDRALRLLPAYYAALIVAGGIVLFLQPVSYFVSEGPNLACTMGNFAVLPMNFFQVNGLDRCALIPVAWSLGLEMQFYLLVPLLLGRPVALLCLGTVSLLIYVMAGLAFIPTDMWGYRLLPGTLFIFLNGVLLGMSVSEGRSALLRLTPILVSATAFVWTVAIALGPQSTTDFAFETGLGLAVATPLLLLALRFRRSAADDMAGRVAYPLFLLHFPMLWLTEAVGMDTHSLLGLATYLLLSILAALGLALGVDAPLANLRRRLRNPSVVIPATIA